MKERNRLNFSQEEILYKPEGSSGNWLRTEFSTTGGSGRARSSLPGNADDICKG